MPMSRTRVFTTGIIFASLVMAAAQKSDQPPMTQYKAESNLVLVPVVVEGANAGKLSQSDFSLSEAGKSEKVALFVPPGQVLTEASASSAPGYVSVTQTLPQTTALNIILVDGMNTQANDQQALRQALLRKISSIDMAHTSTAVYALGRKLRILQSFTSDPRLLRAAVEHFQTEPPKNLDNPSYAKDAEQVLSRLGQAGGSETADATDSLTGMLFAIQQFEFDEAQNQLQNRIEDTSAALETIAKSVAVFPGRKNLIWISGAFPLATYSSARDNAAFLGTNKFGVNSGPSGDNRDFGAAFQRATLALSNAGVSVYAVDATRLAGGALTGGIDQSARGVADQRQALADNLSQEASTREDRQSTLMKVAEDTGGRAFLNSNDPAEAFRRAQEDASHTYMIGYYSSNKKQDGKFRPIKVSVAGSGLTVRYRKGYAPAPPEVPKNVNKDDLLKQAIANPLPATEMLFKAHFVVVEKKPNVEFMVEPNSITFTPGEKDDKHCELAFAVAFVSPAGEITHVDEKTISSSFDADKLANVQKAGLGFRLEIQTPHHGDHLRILVHDKQSGRSGRIDAAL